MGFQKTGILFIYIQEDKKFSTFLNNVQQHKMLSLHVLYFQLRYWKQLWKRADNTVQSFWRTVPSTYKHHTFLWKGDTNISICQFLNLKKKKMGQVLYKAALWYHIAIFQDDKSHSVKINTNFWMVCWPPPQCFHNWRF